MQQKLHGKKRSYFFKAQTLQVKNNEEVRITITASRRNKDGSAVRKSIFLYQQDLPAFIRALEGLQ